tara:strand:- start:964 stop:1467 length:504 start_codon:yes stop_codon:yes gene_type:complete
MKTIKSIDGKSFLIGGLLACTLFFATGAGAGAGSGAKIDPATGLPLGQGLPSGGKPMINPITGLPLAETTAKGLPGMGVPGQAIDPVTGLPIGGMGGMGGHRWSSLQQWQVISVENKPPFDTGDPKNAGETANWIRKKTQRVRGKEPFAVTMDKSGKARVWYRERVK